MKHIFTFVLFAALASNTYATVHTVTCQNNPSHFLPVTANAIVGDTIHWTWVAGTHVVGPINATDIPAGAAMWSAPIDAGNLSFSYVVKVAGNYHYVCHPATPHGEDAYIVVSNATTGIQPFSTVPHLSSAYPNPFSEKITIETPNADQIVIYNILGESIRSFQLKNGETKLEADLGTLPKGVFFYVILKIIKS
jgi:plastocyanin